MKFLVVMTGRDCEPWARRAVESVLSQQGVDFEVVTVDDGSKDKTESEILAAKGDLAGRVTMIRHWESVGAMASQWEAWHEVALAPEDVVVWVDLDDRLAHDFVLARVAQEYEQGALLTYGSYVPDPPDRGCPPARPYPPLISRRRHFRSFMRSGRGILHNHLRTCSWQVLSQLTEEDCRDDDGEWWQTGPDMAVMLPALEIVGTRYAFIPDVLYVYTSDRAEAEWREKPEVVRRNHQQMFRRPTKVPVARERTTPRERAAARAAARQR